jgi:energy-coupling factor transporter transmembrane protein EcfT
LQDNSLSNCKFYLFIFFFLLLYLNFIYFIYFIYFLFLFIFTYIILFYFILFYFILFYFILFYFILFYFILIYFIFYFVFNSKENSDIEKELKINSENTKLSQNKGQEMVIICSECLEKILFYEKSTKVCPNCSSTSFLIEKKYALVERIASGGFGSVFKAIKLDDKKIFAVKKRISESKEKINAWEEEIRIHLSIQSIKGLLLPK